MKNFSSSFVSGRHQFKYESSVNAKKEKNTNYKLMK